MINDLSIHLEIINHPSPIHQSSINHPSPIHQSSTHNTQQDRDIQSNRASSQHQRSSTVTTSYVSREKMWRGSDHHILLVWGKGCSFVRSLVRSFVPLHDKGSGVKKKPPSITIHCHQRIDPLLIINNTQKRNCDDIY